MVERLTAPDSGIWEVNFDSLGSMLDYVSQPNPITTSAANGTKEWTGTATVQEAIDLARNGWAKGRKQMVEGVRDAFRGMKTHAITNGEVLDVAGAVPLAPIAAAGDPCCMLDFVPVERAAKPIVKLLIPCGAAAVVKGKYMINRGIALLTLIDALEHSGQRCEIDMSWYGECGHEHKNRRDFRINVKQPQDDLDLDKMAFILAHPAFLRRLVFSIVDHSKGGLDFAGKTLGKSIRMPYPPQGWNYLPGVDMNNESEYNSIEKAIETLTPLMIENPERAETSS